MQQISKFLGGGVFQKVGGVGGGWGFVEGGGGGGGGWGGCSAIPVALPVKLSHIYPA